MSYNNPQFFAQPQVGATHHGDFLSFGNQPNLNSNPGVAQPNPFATVVSPRPQTQFGNQLSSNPGVKPNPFATVNPQPQPQPQVNPFATNVSNVAKPNPFATVVAKPQQPPVANPLETREYLEGRIRELELIYKDLLEVFRKLQEENAYLRSELSKKDGGLSQSHQELEMKLQQQQEQFLVANKTMRSHLENTKTQYEQEKKKLIADQVAFAKNSVNQYLFRFDDSQFPGNMAANGEDVMQGTVKLKECYDGLLSAIEEGSDIVGPSRRLADHMQKLLEDAKGLSNRIDDPELKIQLMEGTRNLTRLTSKLLSDGQEMIGRRPNGQEINEMRSRQNNFNHTASDINNSIKNSGKKGMDSLDSLAEKELKNASRIIAEAAESLKRQAAQQKLEEDERIRQQMLLGFDISEIDRKGSNVGAIALGVTEAAQMLIDSAAAAQQERVERGIEAAKNNQAYHVDPMWAEGLISAAKAVASSMRVLVGSANNAIKGNVDEASLVSCCRAVAAHTGKLQISSKVKADRDSKAQIQMDKAAKMVKDTTNDLVTETKRVAAFEEVDIGIKVKETEVGNIRAEMELEGYVSRFRADVDKANQRLYEVRRGMYGESNANEEKKKASAIPSKPVNSSYKPLASALVDTTPIVSPFGKSAATTVVSQPTLSPSFASFADMTDAEEEVLPKYMQSKLVIKEDGSKIDKALKAKKELEIKPRPLHLQHDLNQGPQNSSQQNISFSPQQTNTFSPPPQNTFSPPQNNLPPNQPAFKSNEAPMEWDSFIANQLEAPSEPAQDANPFFGGQANDNPFAGGDANPFLSPPSQSPYSQPKNSANPFF